LQINFVAKVALRVYYIYIILNKRMVVVVPNIKPISELRNYTSVVGEVSYGSRVYLTKNGHGTITMIDMCELDEIEKELALYKFKYEVAKAEKSIQEEGTISADELEAELGV
jgi:hypothetical protein